MAVAMAESDSNVSLPLETETHQPIFTLRPFLDPMSLILHQNSDSNQPFPLRLTTDCYFMERGPRYRAYAELRESKLKLRMRTMTMEQQEPGDEVIHDFKTTPPKKQVRFSQAATLSSGRKGLSSPSAVAQSVPDFSAVLRKENRRPVNTLPSLIETTPPSSKGGSWSKGRGVLSNSRGSKSAGDKRGGGGGGGGGLMARKIYASVEELRSLSSAAANAISGENRGGRSSSKALMGKTVLGYRQL